MELENKHLRERPGPRLVHDVLRISMETAQAIVFFCEVDAVGMVRFGADGEVQRLVMDLLTADAWTVFPRKVVTYS